MLVLGAPPSSSSATKVIASPVYYLGEVNTAEPIGREALQLLGGKFEEVSKQESKASAFPDEKIVIPDGITPQNLKNFTLYDMLGFSGELGSAADADVIKRAYNKAVLKYHPDKAQYKTADGKEDRTVFLKIQEAMNVLSNDTKRRAYDSQLPFDERIPNDEITQKALAKGPHKFFKLYGPIFQRNGRFAVKKPVPDIGNMETPMDEVYKFYSYCVRFESWRDFTGKGAEYKPDDAGSREEKRYMQKENEKLAKKLKAKEMERLITLTNLAQKYDPRIVADKEKIKEAKNSVKNAKENAEKKKQEAEANANIWHEKLEEEALLKRGGTSKAEKDKFKKAQSKERNTLKKLLRNSSALGHGEGEYGIITSDDVDVLCSNCQMDDLKEMNEAMGGEPAIKDQSIMKTDGFTVVKETLDRMKQISVLAQEDEKMAKAAKKLESETKAPKKTGKGDVQVREWSEAEIEKIVECTKRYPAGKPDRWQFAANNMNVTFKPSVLFTAVECLVCAYEQANK